MKYQDFSIYEKIIFSPRAVKILFLSFTCEDIAISDILRQVTILAVSKMNKKSCVLCGNFISIYKINRTLHGRLGIRILSFRAESISHA